MRDGLPGGGQFVETEDKVRLLNSLSKTGLSKIEVTSFVSPKAVPLLADAEAVLMAIDRQAGVSYSAIPNIRVSIALSVELDEVNVVMSVSEVHNIANLRMTCDESLAQFMRFVATVAVLSKWDARDSVWLSIYRASEESTVLDWAKRYQDVGIDS